MFGWLSGLVLYLIEKEDHEVRFHAAQSVIVSGAVTISLVVLNVVTLVPGVGIIAFGLATLLSIAAFALWVYLVIQGFTGQHASLPVSGPLAEEWADRTV